MTIQPQGQKRPRSIWIPPTEVSSATFTTGNSGPPPTVTPLHHAAPRPATTSEQNVYSCDITILTVFAPAKLHNATFSSSVAVVEPNSSPLLGPLETSKIDVGKCNWDANNRDSFFLGVRIVWLFRLGW
jgi:hypothetical protein